MTTDKCPKCDTEPPAIHAVLGHLYDTPTSYPDRLNTRRNPLTADRLG
jgi:hypothetical protein